MSDTLNTDYTTEPVGGGAESLPDPTPPSRPDRSPSDPGADELSGTELGGAHTVAANAELDGEVQR